MFDDLEDEADQSFNANELMNFGDYANKRKNLSIKDVFDKKKQNEINNDDDDGWGLSDNDEPVQKEIVMSKDEAKSKNLNKLNDEELAAHKKGMDKLFN